MRTRPGCQEASSEPRWCKRCSLPASGLVARWGQEAENPDCRVQAPQTSGLQLSLGPGGGLLLPQAEASGLLGGGTLAASSTQAWPMGRLSLSHRSLECLKERWGEQRLASLGFC